MFFGFIEGIFILFQVVTEVPRYIHNIKQKIDVGGREHNNKMAIERRKKCCDRGRSTNILATNGANERDTFSYQVQKAMMLMVKCLVTLFNHLLECLGDLYATM